MIKKIVLGVIATLSITFAANAQSAKFAYVSQERVFDSIPTMISAEKMMQDEYDKAERILAEMQTEIQLAEESYNAERASLDPTVAEYRLSNLNKKKYAFQMEYETTQNDLAILQERLVAPIEKNFLQAIKNIALKHQITYMFYEEAMAYVAEGAVDLTAEVRAELIRLENIRVNGGTTGG